MVQQRNIALCIVLSIVTCGIYGIIWYIKLTDETNMVAPPNPAGKPYTSGGLAFILMIVTCDIYGIYWAYKQGEKLDAAKSARGLPTSNQAVVYLILQLFMPIIGWAMMQNQLNELVGPTQNM